MRQKQKGYNLYYIFIFFLFSAPLIFASLHLSNPELEIPVYVYAIEIAGTGCFWWSGIFLVKRVKKMKLISEDEESTDSVYKEIQREISEKYLYKTQNVEVYADEKEEGFEMQGFFNTLTFDIYENDGEENKK
jgi:hypothetical protein